VLKPIKFLWINFIPKIIDDEYFWVEEEKSRSNEGKTRSNSYKTKLKKKKLCHERKRLKRKFVSTT